MWHYRINNVLVQLDPTFSTNQCIATGSPFYCGLDIRYASGPNAGIIQAFLNNAEDVQANRFGQLRHFSFPDKIAFDTCTLVHALEQISKGSLQPQILQLPRREVAAYIAQLNDYVIDYICYFGGC